MARCSAMSKRSGEQCKRAALPGASVCRMHGAGAPQVQAAAARRLALGEARTELVKLGHPLDVEPAQAMLDMVCEAAGNVAVLRRLVQGLDHEMGTLSFEPGDGEAPRFGMRAIAGPTGSLSKLNEAAVHVLVVMYNDERERLVKWAKMCRDAGVDERRIEIAEAQGRELASVLRAAIDGFVETLVGLGLDAVVIEQAYRDQLPGIVRGAIEQVRREEGQ